MASPYRWVLGFRDDGITQFADAGDTDHTFVARLQPARRLVTESDAGRSARGDDVAGFEGHHARKIRDQVRDA